MMKANVLLKSQEVVDWHKFPWTRIHLDKVIDWEMIVRDFSHLNIFLINLHLIPIISLSLLLFLLVWTIYEQVAVSSVDLGNVQLAKKYYIFSQDNEISIFFAYLCRFVIQRLENNFPNLARVTVLHGMLMEAQGDLIGAKSFHELELSKKILLALEDLILIQPENTFHILKYAETAYTVGEYE
ncbi:hypothetical protein PSHT_06312, partial [Puccinia striiformis]